jgi:hypothetical protein
VVTAAALLPLYMHLPALRNAGDDGAPGARLVAEYELPAAALAELAARRSAEDAAPLPRHEIVHAEAVPWTGPRQSAGPELSPLNLVVSIAGTARARGEVRSQWQAGWQEDQPPGRRWVVPLAGPRRSGVEAGTRLSIRVASGPVSFRTARNVLPYIGLVRSSNFEIDEVRVQVWSGVAPTRWGRLLGGLGLAAGVLLAAAWAWRRVHEAPEAVARGPWRAAPATLPGRTVPPAPDRTETAASPAGPANGERVVDALHHLLSAGLAAPHEPDTRRPSRRRR